MLNNVNYMMIFLSNVRRDRRGVTALEYGLIASLIAVAIVGALTTFGQNLATEFNYLATEI